MTFRSGHDRPAYSLSDSDRPGPPGSSASRIGRTPRAFPGSHPAVRGRRDVVSGNGRYSERSDRHRDVPAVASPRGTAEQRSEEASEGLKWETAKGLTDVVRPMASPTRCLSRR